MVVRHTHVGADVLVLGRVFRANCSVIREIKPISKTTFTRWPMLTVWTLRHWAWVSALGDNFGTDYFRKQTFYTSFCYWVRHSGEANGQIDNKICSTGLRLWGTL